MLTPSYLDVMEVIGADHPGAAVFAAGVAGIGYTRADIEVRWDWFRKGWDAKQASDRSDFEDEFRIPTSIVVNEGTFERIGNRTGQPRQPTPAMLALFAKEGGE